MGGSEVLARTEKKKLIVILQGVPTEDTVGVARALVDGGVKLIGITYNHYKGDPEVYSEGQMMAVRAAVGDRARTGAGIALTVDQVELVCRLGAGYIVSPNSNDAVIKRTKELDAAFTPDAMTPTEIVHVENCGADIVRLYTTDDINHVEYLIGPSGHIPMQATCSVSLDMIPQFLEAGTKAFGAKTFLTNDLIKKEDYKETEKRTREHIEIIKANS